MARPSLTENEVSQTRNALLDAAQRLFEDGGFDAMSFRAIASDVGCSHTKPYSYFDGKADLVDHLRLRSYEWLRDVLTVAASNRDDPLEALDDLANAYVKAGRDRPRMYELLYTDQGSMSETEPRLMTAKLAAIGVCEMVIESAAATGRATFASDPSTTAHVFWAAAHGLVSLDAGGFLVVGRSIEELMPVLFTTVIAGAIRE